MTHKLHYGPHEITIKNDGDLPAILDRIEQAANSGKAVWVEIGTDGDTHRLLIQQGIPVFVRRTSPNMVSF